MQRRVFLVLFSYFAFLIPCFATETLRQNITAITPAENTNIVVPAPYTQHIVLLYKITTKEQAETKENPPNTMFILKKGNNDDSFLLPNFSINKEYKLSTNKGIIHIIPQKDSLAIQIPKNAGLQSALLIQQNGGLYLIFLNAHYKDESLFNTSLNDVSVDKVGFMQDSATKNLLQEANYEISSWRYFLVLGIMIAILIALYLIKLRQNRGTQDSQIIVEQTKIVDSKNKITLVRFGEMRYLLGMNPHGITLLDSFHVNAETSREKDVAKPHQNDMKKDINKESFMRLLKGN